MRHTKIVRIIYLVATLLLLASFALDVYYSSSMSDEYRVDDDWVMILAYFVGFVSFIVAIYGFVLVFYTIFKRLHMRAIIYLLIVFTAMVTGIVLEMPIKGHLYAWFPQLCLNPLKPGQSATVCYEEEIGGGFGINPVAEAEIVFNPGDDMSLPYNQWPSDLKKSFYMCPKAKQLAKHVYLCHYDTL